MINDDKQCVDKRLRKSCSSLTTHNFKGDQFSADGQESTAKIKDLAAF